MIISAFRNSTYQNKLLQDLIKEKNQSEEEAGKKIAKWWESEHQTWLAVDLQVVSRWWRIIELRNINKYTDRLKANAHNYWFHQSYSKWIEIDGKVKERRHWRYLGINLATELFENNISFSEYYMIIK